MMIGGQQQKFLSGDILPLTKLNNFYLGGVRSRNVKVLWIEREMDRTLGN
jgi:hypothetical protein